MIDIRATRSRVLPAKAGIQYAAASRFYHWRSGILGGFNRSSRAMTACARLVICPSGGLLKGLSSLISDFPKNILVPTHPKSLLEFFASHPTRGAYHDRHGRGVRMRWTRQRFARDGIAGRVGERPVSDQQRADERCCSVRQNRVVLTPRRWCQVCGVASAQPGLDKNISAGDG